MTSMHLILTNKMSTDNAGVNDTHQEMTTFRSAQRGVTDIPRRNDADFHCTEQVLGNGLLSQKEMMSPRGGVGIPAPYFLVVDTSCDAHSTSWISRRGSS